jgi:riboflavin synthase
MFTGIIKAMGKVAAIERRGGDVRLSVHSAAMPFSSYAIGESIAVNGVCLTAVALEDDSFATDVSTETLDVTVLGDLGVGDAVNLEPSLALGERLGGHLVSGHVDCVGSVVTRNEEARSVRFGIELPDEYARYVAKKGSVTVDGVSLTVNEVSRNRFSVNIIPHTAEATIIGNYTVGTRVNIEVDLLARYIERLLAKDDDGLSMDTLREHGYV